LIELFLALFKHEENNTKINENINNIRPWNISPNITPNKNGNVIIVNKAGFIS